MSDQGKVVITMTVPTAVTAMGLAISGAGTHSATLRAVGVTADHTASAVVKGPVQIGGTALATAAVAISAGGLLQANAAGKMIVAVDDGLAMAVALEGAAADGVLFNVKLL